MLTHNYDKTGLFITVPLIYESAQKCPEYTSQVLKVVANKIEQFATMNPVEMLPMDQTNRYPWGKIMININKITNFPFQGTVFVRISLPPWQICTRRIMDNRFDINQVFFIPVASNFFTLKFEIINLSSDGWLREHFTEHVIASYDIRLPDINKEPFEKDGTLQLPISIERLDFKKHGLTPVVLPPEPEQL